MWHLIWNIFSTCVSLFRVLLLHFGLCRWNPWNARLSYTTTRGRRFNSFQGKVEATDDSFLVSSVCVSHCGQRTSPKDNIYIVSSQILPIYCQSIHPNLEKCQDICFKTLKESGWSFIHCNLYGIINGSCLVQVCQRSIFVCKHYTFS